MPRTRRGIHLESSCEVSAIEPAFGGGSPERTEDYDESRLADMGSGSPPAGFDNWRFVGCDPNERPPRHVPRVADHCIGRFCLRPAPPAVRARHLTVQCRRHRGLDSTNSPNNATCSNVSSPVPAHMLGRLR